MRASALSLCKKQSSTYNKYACGCFLHAPSICSTYLQVEGITLYLRRRIFQNRHGWTRGKTAAMFLHRKNSPSANVHGRTFRTVPPGVFCTLLASAPPICKLRGLLSIYADGYFRTATDGRGVKQQRCFCTVKTRHRQMYTDVHFVPCLRVFFARS